MEKNRDNKHAPVLLVSPRSSTATEKFFIPCNEIPLSLCYLAAYLESRGIGCDLLDLDAAPADFSFEAYLAERRPDVVGFTSFSPYIENAHRLALATKAALPDAVTVIGGYHASAFPVETLEEFPGFDVLVYGEGERTLAELYERYAKSEEVPPDLPGTAVRDGGKVVKNPPVEQFADIDSLPFPAREKLFLERYVPNPVNYLRLPTTAILASRGCRFGCTFCSKFLFRGERVRSAENILAEMLECDARFGIRDFRFYDDNFTWHRENCFKFCEEARVRAPKISWNCFSRVDCIDAELLAAMKSAGCYQVKYGVETGNEKTLKTINKNITFEQSREAIALAKKAGIECQISMMIGLPGETREDILKTIAFSVELSPDLILFNVFKPIPGSILYNKLKKENMLLTERWEDLLVKTPKPVVKGSLPADELEELMKKAYTSFYFRPAYILRRLKWLARFPARELRRYAAAARIFTRAFYSR